MSYIKAEEILPKELLESIQEYVDGKTIYIPRKEERRRPWGCGTSYRDELEHRNAKICEEFRLGLSRRQLSEKYCLSEKSIGRILREK